MTSKEYLCSHLRYLYLCTSELNILWHMTHISGGKTLLQEPAQKLRDRDRDRTVETIGGKPLKPGPSKKLDKSDGTTQTETGWLFQRQRGAFSEFSRERGGNQP